MECYKQENWDWECKERDERGITHTNDGSRIENYQMECESESVYGGSRAEDSPEELKDGNLLVCAIQ